jgi:hypothetical protein
MTTPTDTSTAPPSAALHFSTDAPARLPSSKADQGHSNADHGDDNGCRQDGHLVGAKSKADDEIVDAERGAGHEQPAHSR